MNIHSILNNKVVRNANWMVSEQIVQMLLSFVISMITTRYLGPSNYGIINYCAAYVAFFSSVCSLGLEGVLVKELVTNPDKEGEFVGTALIMRIAAGILSIISIMIILFIVDDGNRTVMLVGLLQSLVLWFKAFEVMDFWFQSKLKSKYVAIIKMASYLIVALYKVYILASAKSIEWFAFSTSLDFLIIAIFLIIIYPRNGGPSLSFKFSTAKALLKNSYHFIISGLFVTVYSQMDKIMIEKFLNETEVGYYSIGTSIFGYWVLVTTAITNAARPSIMSQKGKDEQKYIKRLKQLYAILIWLSIAAALFFTLFGRFVIPMLYGKAYNPSVPLVTITMWYAPFSVIGTARGIWIVCENKNRYVKYYMFIGAAVNVALNALWIPFIGTYGAALATFITQLIISLIAPMLFKETRIHTKYVIQAFFLKGIR